MIMIICGGFIALCGVLLLLADPFSGIIAIAGGIGFILWGRKRRIQKEARRQAEVSREIQGYIDETTAPTTRPAPPAPSAPAKAPKKSSGRSPKTFSFRLAGVVFPCKYKSYTDRQEIIALTEIGEPLELKRYEWEGEPALAVMNPRLGADLGVVPARNVDRVLKLMEQYPLEIYVEENTEFDYKGEDYTGCDIRINCIKR